MENYKELTIEITDYCPNGCKYCSSESTNIYVNSIEISIEHVRDILAYKQFDRIIISGGEPLSHPQFYSILQLCKLHTKDVVVYTNALTHIIYNSNVIDGIYVETNLTILPNTKSVHILKRIEQGKEVTRPEVKFSKNFTDNCDCNKHVLKPDGTLVKSPCKKYNKVE